MHPETRGVHHVGLTVPDLAAARRFFVEQLGHRELGGMPDYPAVFLGDGAVMITLWQVKDPGQAVPFDRTRNIGLHHLALAVEGQAALDALYERLRDVADVEMEFAPEPLGGGPTRHMMVRIPGGIRVEFIAKAG
ncbi:MAG: VOC family protein [Deltaproteobacteria bacterium]|nr:VOC family protein [Deltaproteobacteria bacterium]